MATRIQKITLLPALILFGLSILFAGFSLIIVEFSLKQILLILISSLFVAGLIYSIYWGYSWIWSKKIHEHEKSLLLRFFSNNKLITGVFLFLGIVTLIWVFQLVHKDLTFWSKEIGTIFFGSRVNEFISLGIGMRVVHYFLIGLSLLFVGLVMLTHRFRSCPYYFGYLGSIYRKKIEISAKCIRCPIKKDCIMTDNRSKFQK